MAGYFVDNPGEGITPNASADFAIQSAINPGAFKSDLFERLLGRKKPTPEQVATAASASMPPAAQVPPSAPPAISSGSSLVGRVLKASSAPPVTPTEQMLASQGLRPPQPQMTPTEQMLAPQGPPRLPPFQGIPQFGPTGRFGAFSPPPAGQFPAPANPNDLPPLPPPGIPTPPYGGGTRYPLGLTDPFTQSQYTGTPLNPFTRHLQTLGLPGAQGYFSGGPIHMRRGGYPHLMMGLPERMASAGAVPSDGRGDGRSDHVPAKLSPGEFVQDAETTALLGNGDSDAGARGWEAIRQEIRKDKGRALAAGRFSPKAKAPSHYARVGIRAASRGDR